MMAGAAETAGTEVAAGAQRAVEGMEAAVEAVPAVLGAARATEEEATALVAMAWVMDKRAAAAFRAEEGRAEEMVEEVATAAVKVMAAARAREEVAAAEVVEVAPRATSPASIPRRVHPRWRSV